MPRNNRKKLSASDGNTNYLQQTGQKDNGIDTGVELKLIDGVSMYIHTGNCQDQGAREYQEDSFGYSNIVDSGILSSKGMFAVLSDGMGGLSNGRAVADYTVQTANSRFSRLDPKINISRQLKEIVNQINDQVSRQYTDNGTSTAGATMVIAYIFKNRIYWASVGDSRLYCFRNGHLIQMNEDHDYRNQMYREYIDTHAGLDSIESDPRKDSLVSFIGKQDIQRIDCSVRGCKIKPDDVFVLCSDGIYNGITEDSIKEILAANGAQAASEKIVQNIKNANFPGQDNMTVMVIKCSKQ